MAISFRAASVAAASFAALALTAAPANATFFGTRDGPAIGIGTSCAAVMEATAREPDRVGEYLELHREAASAIVGAGFRGQRDVPQGIALYKAAQIDGIARQPEAEGVLREVSDECSASLAALGSLRPDRAAVAIGAMCAAWLDGTARQPEVEDKLRDAYADGVSQIAATQARSSNYVKAEAFGIVKAAQIAAVSRQPAKASDLKAVAETCVGDISRY